MKDFYQFIGIATCFLSVIVSFFSMFTSFENAYQIESLCNRVAELEDAQEEKQ